MLILGGIVAILVIVIVGKYKKRKIKCCMKYSKSVLIDEKSYKRDPLIGN